MSRINEKLGMKPAGKRNMMKLPEDRALRNRITSARCPECGRTGANLSKTEKTPHLFCTHCSHLWPLPAEGA